nr:casein kinase 1-like protein 2 [Quercus suber]
MAVYFLKGKLPWQGLKAEGVEQNYRMVMEMKISTTALQLCSELPKEFRDYMVIVQGLHDGDRPDYESLRRSFRQLAQREGYEDDSVFDWTIRDYTERVRVSTPTSAGSHNVQLACQDGAASESSHGAYPLARPLVVFVRLRLAMP